MKDLLDIHAEAAAALAEGRAVVALESTVIAQGLPYPRNLETARAMEKAVRGAGAVPATIGLSGGRIKVGLDENLLERFARSETVTKVSRRDLAAVLAGGGDGATTVAATICIAARAGIRIFATGGIGGVHRGVAASADISADLMELARTPVAVVCAGAKAILDLPRTLEVLETLGVPVIGYRTDRLPGFYSEDSGLALETRVDGPAEAARIVGAQWALGLGGGLVIANPPPAAVALDRGEVEGWIDAALAEAARRGVAGKALTPFLLARLAELSGGRTLEANSALLEANAALAAEIAVAGSIRAKQ